MAIFPEEQAVHEDARVFAMKPTGQSVQTDAPLELNFPFRHGEHVVVEPLE